MIVDDDEPIIFSMNDYFTEHGWKVDCARAIDEAKALASARDYDVVITDLHLTGLHSAEGLEVVRHVRASGSARVIVLTAYGSEELERVAMRLGADAFLQKTMPISEIAQLATRLTA